MHTYTGLGSSIKELCILVLFQHNPTHLVPSPPRLRNVDLAEILAAWHFFSCSRQSICVRLEATNSLRFPHNRLIFLLYFLNFHIFSSFFIASRAQSQSSMHPCSPRGYQFLARPSQSADLFFSIFFFIFSQPFSSLQGPRAPCSCATRSCPVTYAAREELIILNGTQQLTRT